MFVYNIRAVKSQSSLLLPLFERLIATAMENTSSQRGENTKQLTHTLELDRTMYCEAREWKEEGRRDIATCI